MIIDPSWSMIMLSYILQFFTDTFEFLLEHPFIIIAFLVYVMILTLDLKEMKRKKKMGKGDQS